MKRLSFFIFLALVCPSLALAGIVQGPYLLNPGKTTMTVSLVTDQSGQAAVEYSANGEPVQMVQSSPEIFQKEGLDPVWHHHLPLYGLTADTVYSYQVRFADEQKGPYSFTTTPPNTEPFTFVVYGDSRGGRPGNPNLIHQEVAARMITWEPSFYVNTGDLISSGEDVEDWKAYFFETTELGAISPLLPVYGNHEFGYDEDLDISGAENWARFFPLPGVGRSNQWYSMDYGNVHLVVLNLEDFYTIMTQDAPQRVFLVNDLKAAAANPHTNFILFFFHQPAYSWKPDRSPNIAAQLIVAPIAEKYGVQIMFAGHNHHYTRAFLNNTEQVVTGGGGAGLYDIYPDVRTKKGYRAHAMQHHYCVVEVESMSMRVTVYAVPGGERLDEFEVFADQPPEPEPGDDDDDDDDSGGDDDETGDDDDQGNNDDSSSGDDDGCG